MKRVKTEIFASGKNMLFQKNGWLILIVIFSLAINLTGLKWGLPSRSLNQLYFNGEDAVRHRIDAIKKQPAGETYKGMGFYLAAHPEEAQKKLPRSWYNPIRSYHPDEYFVIKSLAAMNPGTLNLNPHQFTVGGAYLYLIALMTFLFSKIGWIKLTGDIGFYFLHPGEIAKFYLLGRLVTALYGAGIVWLTYLIAKKLWRSEKAGILSGFLAAVSPLILINAHYMYVDIPGVFWITAAIYLAVCVSAVPDRPGWHKYFLMGIFSGLATGNKIPFLISLLIPFVNIFQKRNALRRDGVISGILWASAGFLTALFLTNPYLFLTFPEPLVELREQTSLTFSGLFYLKSLVFGLGYPLTAFLIIGFIYCLCRKKNQKTCFVPACWVIVFFFFISLFGKHFTRYILPIIPALIFTGVGFWIEPSSDRTVNFLKKTIIVFISGFAFLYGMAYLSLFLKENTRTLAGEWIKKNIPSEATIGLTEVPWQFQMAPLDEDRYQLKVTGYDLKKMQTARPDYFIISSFQGRIAPVPEQIPAERNLFWGEFEKSKKYQALAS
ncbi:MAG: phospholipid carrier-dependent glycosyltransferase, partial [Candidatus Ratteibacteria bacterium]